MGSKRIGVTSLTFQGHVTIRIGICHFLMLLLVLWTQASISNGSEIGLFIGECDAITDMTLNDLKTKVKVIHFGANRYDFLYADNSNCCSGTHCLAEIYTYVTDR